MHKITDMAMARLEFPKRLAHAIEGVGLVARSSDMAGLAVRKDSRDSALRFKVKLG